MSEESDDAAALAMQYENYLERLEQDISEKIWTMRDGNRIKIKNMEDGHLLNTIRFMQKKEELSYPVWFYAAILRNLTEEAKKRKLEM